MCSCMLYWSALNAINERVRGMRVQARPRHQPGSTVIHRNGMEQGTGML